MNKADLLKLEKHAHLSISELRAKQPELAKPLVEGLEKRALRKAVTRLTGTSEKLRKVVAKMRIPLDAGSENVKLRDATLKSIREAIAKDDKLKGDEELKKELDALEKEKPRAPTPGAAVDATLADSLRLDQPISFHPEFRRQLDAARLFRLSDALGLGDKMAETLIKEVRRVSDITDERLERLAKDKKLSDQEAKDAGLAVSLYNVLDERTELVAEVKKSVASVRELVKFDKPAWVKLIQDGNAQPPGDISAEDYADLLMKKVRRLFPTDALTHNLMQVKVGEVLKEHAGLAELRKLNPKVSLIGSTDFDSLKTDGLDAAEVKTLRARLEGTRQLANRYSGMKLGSVLDDEDLPDAEKDKEVQRRTEFANAFFLDNAEVLSADLTTGSAALNGFKFKAGATDTDKAMALATARTYQRTLAVTEDVSDAELLVVGGFPSAMSLAATPVEKVAAKTGLKAELAARYREKARDISSGVTAHVGTLIDILKGGFTDTAVGNISTEVAGYLKELPGFADFFGNQDFCKCKHCQSILGPAAYFVDLMCFVDDHVTKAVFTGGNTNHALALQTRRPDLWTLELTCENTNQAIPYLVIINEILENAVARHAGFAGDFGDRTAVGTKVYKDTLPDLVNSFQQPFHLAFEELRTYLGHFERSLADLAEAGMATADALARLRLELPPKDFQLITQPNASLPFLRNIFGDLAFAEVAGVIQKFDAQLLLKPMGVDRDELSELIATRFVTADGTVSVRIKAEKRTVDSIQNDIEYVTGLTAASLDRLHRFVRLWRATQWRIGELDLVLVHVKAAGIGTGLDAATVQAVARIHRLQRTREVPVEELIALWSSLPQAAVLRHVPDDDDGSGPAVFPPPVSPLARLTLSLLDRQFNQPRFTSAGGSLPQPATLFLHPALASVPPLSVDANLHRLLAGTGTTEGELHQLIVGLARPLGVDPSSADDNKKKFALNLRNLSLLYRHAHIAKLLRVTVPELFALASLTPILRLPVIERLEDLEALLDLHSWWQTTPWTLAELVAITRPGIPPIVTTLAPLASTAAGQSVTYTPTVFGTVLPAETITFAANADLGAIVADWNGKAQRTEAYRSDSYGIATASGLHLSFRTKVAAGDDTTLEVTSDALGLFTAAPPLKVPGGSVAPPLPQPEVLSPSVAAAELVSRVTESESLVFADTAFALLPPVPPTATSGAAVPGTAGGESITYVPVIDGRTEATETVTFVANAGLDDVIADWNRQATLLKAFRSDASGQGAVAGTYLSLRVEGAAGSDTRFTITADSASLFTAAVPKEFRGAEITEEQSRALVAANSAVLELIDGQEHYRLASGFDPNAALTLPATIAPALAPRLQDVLRRHHSKAVLLTLLPGAVSSSPESTPVLVQMLSENLDDNDYFLELRGDAAPPSRISSLIARLRRLDTLFAQHTVFSAENLAFVKDQAATFGIASFDRVPPAALRRVDMFRSLTEAGLALDQPEAVRDAPPDLKALLLAFDPVARFANADQAQLASLLGCDTALVQSLQSQLALSSTPFEVLAELLRAATAAKAIGIGGATFKLAQSTAYDDLAAASLSVQAAFRAKYEDEAEWQKNAEPFRDALLSRRRDGLVAYLVHSGPVQFDEVNDLYHYFLLDVQLEGCARTSRVAAAIDSVQLYVQRCLMNLEETPPGDARPAHVLPRSIPSDEWEWRKNYRVWEANRKIFLYPENYIEPELRDNKTPLFATLEEELLSKEITDEAILDAYSRYLRGFDELAHLTIAGSYHEKDESARSDVLHLLGVTADDPPVFYYRRVENAHFGAASDDRATHWGPWEKLDVQVPVRKVAPIIHNGQLYVYWIRYVSKPLNRVKDGESKFVGYQHRAYIEFTKRKLDGSWTTPQKLRLDEAPFKAGTFPGSYQEDGVVLDPIVPKDKDAIDLFFFEITIYNNYEPLYDDKTHDVPRDDYSLGGFAWDQLYPSTGDSLFLRGVNFQMWSPVDLYRLSIGARYELEDPADYGVPWLNPAVFIFIWLISGGQFDLTKLLPARLVWSRANGSRRDLHSTPSGLPCFDTYAYASLLVDEARFKKYESPLAAVDPAGGAGVWTGPQWSEEVTDYLADRLTENKIVDVAAGVSVEVVNGSVGDVVIQTARDAFYMQGGVREDGKYHLRRLNTSVSEDIASILFNRGLSELLATKTQLSLKEHSTDINVVSSKVHDATNTGTLDFQGPMGGYLREVFFHIPFLIANHLNSQGRYEDAQRWYHYIFDPTASETIDVPGGLSPEERRRRELDRNWRYREFRGLTLQSFRAQLTDDVAIEEYKRDPFNPHAIARLRTSAYQKAIVMKYVDNLLDWGDHLFAQAFAQLNPEYLREATLKYVFAQEILGDRPAQLGDCGEGKVAPKVFPKIKEELADGSEFLMELESVIVIRYRLGSVSKFESKLVSVDTERAAKETGRIYAAAGPAVAVAPEARRAIVAPTPKLVREMIAAAPANVKERAARFTVADGIVAKKGKDETRVTLPKLYDGLLKPKRKWIPDWGFSIIREVSPIFCVPGNDRMLRYWDLVDDRLYKLRHCLDIDGVPRQLPLFAPEIDPGLLVGGKAAGLSLEDVLGASAGGVPPYRFRYLVEKAKSFAATVQGFGAGLLGALEKRDAEELVKLRNVHQKNILALTSEVKRNELKIAEQSLEIVARKQAAAQYRSDYYAGLISSGLSPWEIAHYASRVTSSVIKGVETTFQTAASISFLIPQLGSPFAMKYGGQEIGNSMASWSKVVGVAAGLAEVTGTVASIQAGFERREQGWEHQQQLAEHDLKAIEREIAVAELRRTIAERGIELHDKAREQHDEVMEFFADKFSNLGLYTHLSRSMQQLHREAYNNALALARLAEQAYRFERPGDGASFVGGEWDASRSGLHAGERLLLGLQNMEKRFIETNPRQSEINQSFSLAQINPQAVIDLKEVGRCEFSIPEFYFDLFYPGQYRRRTRAVRVTIPCITGPYTNVSAKLTLLKSYIRKEATLGATNLFEVPPNRTTSVATSTAQGDAGVFELSFRDERYMPFEGAGAVSEWRLELPSAFRTFDYQSINDVILNISYTAEDDGVLRQQVEAQNAAAQGTLLNFLSSSTLTRVFSLRQEFSSAFNRLVQAPSGTAVTIDVGERHFPLFLQGRALTAASASLVLAVRSRAAVGTVAISVNGTAATGFSNPVNPPAPGSPFGGLPAKSIAGAFAGGLKRQHTIVVDDAGNLAAPAAAGGPLFDADKLLDVLLVVGYRL